VKGVTKIEVYKDTGSDDQEIIEIFEVPGRDG